MSRSRVSELTAIPDSTLRDWNTGQRGVADPATQILKPCEPLCKRETGPERLLFSWFMTFLALETEWKHPMLIRQQLSNDRILVAWEGVTDFRWQQRLDLEAKRHEDEALLRRYRRASELEEARSWLERTQLSYLR